MIKIYTTPTCPWCNATKDFLNKNNIKFKEIDVSRDRKSAEEMIKKSGQYSVPVLDINSEIIVGFDKERIEQLVKK